MIGTPSAICWLAKHVCGLWTGAHERWPSEQPHRLRGLATDTAGRPSNRMLRRRKAAPCYHNLIVFDGHGTIDGSLDGLLLAVRPADVDRDGVGMGAEAKVQSHVVLIALPRCSLDLPK